MPVKIPPRSWAACRFGSILNSGVAAQLSVEIRGQIYKTTLESLPFTEKPAVQPHDGLFVFWNQDSLLHQIKIGPFKATASIACQAT